MGEKAALFLYLERFIYSSLKRKIMAIFNSFLLGQVSQSVGNVTMCQYRGESVARGKIKFRKDNPTPEMLDMRARIKELGSLAKRLLPVIRKGFAGVGDGTVLSAFMQANLDKVEVTGEHVATVDFDLLKLASGMLRTPSMTLTLDSTGGQLAIMTMAQEALGDFAHTDDLLYLVLIETELRQAVMLNVGTRGVVETTSFSLPEDWTVAKVKAYCFAAAKQGKNVSDSKLLSIGTQP